MHPYESKIWVLCVHNPDLLVAIQFEISFGTKFNAKQRPLNQINLRSRVSIYQLFFYGFLITRDPSVL